MISLEQIRALEARVEKAVVLIDKLRKENAELERNLEEASRDQEQLRSAAAELERKAQAAEAETAVYRERALVAEKKALDLDTKAEELRREQGRIEEGLSHALAKLDAFEDLVMGISSAEASAEAEVKAEVSAEGEETKVADRSPPAPEPEEAPPSGEPFRGESLLDLSSTGEQSPEGPAPGAGNELDIF